MLVAFLLSACSNTPKGILEQEDMALLMADIHMGEAVVDADYRHFATDSSRRLLRQNILAQHKVSQEMMDTSLVWYGNHIEDYVKVYERTIEILEDRQQQIGRSTSEQIALWGDSVNVWPHNPSYTLSERMPSRMLRFTLTPDSTWHPGDVYILRYKTLGEYAPVLSRLLIDYQEGITDYANSMQQAKGWFRSRIAMDTLLTPRRLYGYILLPTEAGAQMHLDSISLTRLHREAAPREYIPYTRIK